MDKIQSGQILFKELKITNRDGSAKSEPSCGGQCSKTEMSWNCGRNKNTATSPTGFGCIGR